MVELVLIAPVLAIVIGGIVQVGLALNYWLDLQRIANQGARWAVVARYPLADGSMCTTAVAPCDPNLETTLADQAQSEGLAPRVCISFPRVDESDPDAEGTSNVGDPVRVRLETEFTFVPILGIGTVEIGADAEMRIEQQRHQVYDATGDC